MLKSLIVFSASAVCLVLGDGDTLRVNVTQHRSCGNRKLVFPNFDQAPVVPDPAAGPNCYRMTGTLVVNAPINGRISAYNEVKNGTAAAPVPCQNKHTDGCRGTFGSCIYCDVCSEVNNLNQAGVRIESKNRKFSCKEGKPGRYEDISLVFCMPSLKQFLDAVHMDRESWDQFVGKQGKTVFMVFRLFENVDLNLMTPDELKATVESHRGEIGCHRLVMNVYSD